MNRLVLMSLLILMSCTSAPKDMPDLSNDQGRVVVKRLASLSGIFETVHTQIDGKEVFTLGNGETNYLDIPPGTHTIHTDHFLGSGADQTFTLEPNQTLTFQTGWFSKGLQMQGNIMIPSSQFNLAQLPLR